MAERSYRLKTNIGSDQSVNVKLSQDIDIYEILSLKIRQENLYKIHSANYGVVVGRVLANDAFGIPNAKVSIFIPLSETDSNRSPIKDLYPYSTVSSTDSKQIRYNLLPNYEKFENHRAVGTFPSKRLVLDDDSVLEMYDKYYKYTTVTNKSGDYMIYGVPVGQQQLHIDLDLSDIGVLSQKPRDFIYKGYSATMFDSPVRFKKSTNIDMLPQIHSQNASINVYPFWGDSDNGEIAITRKDINIQYQFETTCVFLGSTLTDNDTNAIGQSCVPDANVGEANQLITNRGKIEMIRKTLDGRVEEVVIEGNDLIDGDGVFCYQIPMNLDYVGMDEYGNIVPTDNPARGIPTRAKVRFRFTLDEVLSDNFTRHKARYLVPNNPPLKGDSITPYVNKDVFDEYYKFGSDTPDDCFRDLYWDKVYTVKNYIPRIQTDLYSENTAQYSGIKGVNKKGARKNTSFPFNKINLNFSAPAYLQLLNVNTYYTNLRHWNRWLRHKYTYTYSMDAAYDEVLEESDAVSLDFYNDWINGCLYFPQWFWYVRQRDSYKAGEPEYESQFCNCDAIESENGGFEMKLLNSCSLAYSSNYLTPINTDPELDMYSSLTEGSPTFIGGIVKEKKNKDNALIYYYSFGNYNKNNNTIGDYIAYVRLYATDIVLLGSLNEDDFHAVPQISKHLPITTANIPSVGSFKNRAGYYYDQKTGEMVKLDESEDVTDYKLHDENTILNGFSSNNGMNWAATYEVTQEKKPWWSSFSWWFRRKKRYVTTIKYTFDKATGLFFGLKPQVQVYKGKWKGTFAVVPASDMKTCVNIERLCELGVTFDGDMTMPYGDGNGVLSRIKDGFINKDELENVELRALFSTLNSEKLEAKMVNDTTGYRTYGFTFEYPTNFDGRLSSQIDAARIDNINIGTDDYRNLDYLDFKFGSRTKASASYVRRKRFGIWYVPGGADNSISITYPERVRHFYSASNNRYSFPVYENSFYFFFGLTPGRTAIDKFNEKYNLFGDKYHDDDGAESESPSIVATNPTSWCDQNGKIVVKLPDNFTFPAKITYYGTDNTLSGTTTTNSLSYTISNLPLGTYAITVEDKNNKSYEDRKTITLGTSVVYYTISKQITTEYVYGMTSSDVSRDDCGIVTFTSFSTIDGIVPITEASSETSGGKIKYRLNNTLYYLEISTENNGDSIENYIQSKNIGEDGIKLWFWRPVKMRFKLTQYCSATSPTANVHEGTIIISDLKNIDIRIGDMPLNMIIGRNEDKQNNYNTNFYNRNAELSLVNDVPNGWFELSNPSVYDRVFNASIGDNKVKSIWENEIGGTLTPYSVVEKRMKYMFSLAEYVYVTSINKDMEINVRVENVEKPVLMLSRPNVNQYNRANIDNTQYCAVKVERKISNYYNVPVIIGDNYINESGDTLSNHLNFNPRYNLSGTKPPLTFIAGFSDNADSQESSELKYQTIPTDVKNLIESTDISLNLDSCTSANTTYHVNGGGTYKSYFPMPTIDMRMGYDMLIISPISGASEDWEYGRISGSVINGVEFAVNEDDNNNILRKSGSDGHTEYIYDVSTGVISKDSSSETKKHKRFKELIFKSGEDNDYTFRLDLSDKYMWNGGRTAAYISSVTGDKGFIESGDMGNSHFSNDLSKDSYPLRRMINYNRVKYSKTFSMTGTSYAYNSLCVTKPTDLKVRVMPGDGNQFGFNRIPGELISIVTSSDIDKCNLTYKIVGDGAEKTCELMSINIDFKKEYSFSDEFTINDGVYDDDKVKRYGVGVLFDYSDHRTMSNIKKATTLSDIDKYFYGSGNQYKQLNGEECKLNLVRSEIINSDYTCIYFVADVLFTENNKYNMNNKVRVVSMSKYVEFDDFTMTREMNKACEEEVEGCKPTITEITYTIKSDFIRKNAKSVIIKVDGVQYDSGSGRITLDKGEKTYIVKFKSNELLGDKIESQLFITLANGITIDCGKWG